jgi:putative glutamine amidotransferase
VRAPVIAVVGYHLPAGRIVKWASGGHAVPERYVEAIRRAGARSLILAPGDEWTAEDLERFDGMLLLGGGDVDPARYDGATHEHIYGVEPDRDALEIALVRDVVGTGLPLLAICRGLQVLNVALGGTLHPHVPDLPGAIDHGVPGGGSATVHDVRLAPGSRTAAAAGRYELASSSHHHQAVDRLGAGLVPVGWTEDELVEAVEHEAGWVVGVQWHPEHTAADDRAQQGLFDALADRARRRVPLGVGAGS